jgi:hypothetical protein
LIDIFFSFFLKIKINRSKFIWMNKIHNLMKHYFINDYISIIKHFINLYFKVKKGQLHNFCLKNESSKQWFSRIQNTWHNVRLKKIIIILACFIYMDRIRSSYHITCQFNSVFHINCSVHSIEIYPYRIWNLHWS